jgi:hypothetical protein
LQPQPARCDSSVSLRFVTLYYLGVVDRQFTDAELQAAVEALSEPGRFRDAESRVSAIAPQLQQILGQALKEGGWFDQAHESQVSQAADEPDETERVSAIKRLLAEETRMGMLVGVAVGWELARELEGKTQNTGED